MYEHNKVTKKVYQSLIIEKNMVVIRDPKKFCFNFDWPKNFDENLKYEAEFIIKSNEFLAKNKTKKRLNNCC